MERTRSDRLSYGYYILNAMSDYIDIHKAGAVIIRNKKLLLTRSRGKSFFVAPGGKLENNETPRQALVRELFEELQATIHESDLEEFGEFYAIAAGSDNKQLKMDVFIVNGLDNEIIPSSEIEEIRWVTSSTSDIEIGSIFLHDVMPKLVADDLID